MKQFKHKCVVTKNGTKMYYKRVKNKWQRISNKVGMKAEKGKRKYMNGEKKAVVIGEKKAVVIGAGPVGLFAAYELLRKGYVVTVYERSPEKTVYDNNNNEIRGFMERNQVIMIRSFTDEWAKSLSFEFNKISCSQDTLPDLSHKPQCKKPVNGSPIISLPINVIQKILLNKCREYNNNNNFIIKFGIEIDDKVLDNILKENPPRYLIITTGGNPESINNWWKKKTSLKSEPKRENVISRNVKILIHGIPSKLDDIPDGNNNVYYNEDISIFKPKVKEDPGKTNWKYRIFLTTDGGMYLAVLSDHGNLLNQFKISDEMLKKPTHEIGEGRNIKNFINEEDSKFIYKTHYKDYMKEKYNVETVDYDNIQDSKEIWTPVFYTAGNYIFKDNNTIVARLGDSAFNLHFFTGSSMNVGMNEVYNLFTDDDYTYEKLINDDKALNKWNNHVEALRRDQKNLWTSTGGFLYLNLNCNILMYMKVFDRLVTKFHENKKSLTQDEQKAFFILKNDWEKISFGNVQEKIINVLLDRDNINRRIPQDCKDSIQNYEFKHIKKFEDLKETFTLFDETFINSPKNVKNATPTDLNIDIENLLQEMLDYKDEEEYEYELEEDDEEDEFEKGINDGKGGKDYPSFNKREIRFDGKYTDGYVYGIGFKDGNSYRLKPNYDNIKLKKIREKYDDGYSDNLDYEYKETHDNDFKGYYDSGFIDGGKKRKTDHTKIVKGKKIHLFRFSN